MTSRSIAILLLTVLLAFTVVSVAWRNYAVASDTYGLMSLATSDGELERPWNPFDNGGWLIGSEVAFWLLSNTQFHAKRCSPLSQAMHRCEMSRISWALRGLSADLSNEPRVAALIDIAMALGADPNEVEDGLPVAHEAVLFGSHNMLNKLVDVGADTSARAVKPGRAYDGYDVLQYADHLYRERKPHLLEQFKAVMIGREKSNIAMHRTVPGVTPLAFANGAPPGTGADRERWADKEVTERLSEGASERGIYGTRGSSEGC